MPRPGHLGGMSEMTQLPLPSNGNTPPDWIHLLPAGSFPAVGGRKTLRVTDPQAVITASMKSGKLVVDENHSTDLAAPRGKGSPAMGWVEQLAVRQDGIWGQVRWTKRGRTALEDHAYRAISPVLVSDPDGTVTQILRAALTNNPDLSLTTLHSRTTEQEGRDMSYPLAALRSRLGLKDDADEVAINQALERSRAAITLHSQAAALAGLRENATPDDVVAALKKQQEQVTLHAASVSSLQNQINELKATNVRMAAENWVSEAGRKKVITDDLKGKLITLHSSDSALAEQIVASLPDAPSGNVTLHSRDQHNGTVQKTVPGLTAAEAALGLTEADLKAGGLL